MKSVLLEKLRTEKFLQNVLLRFIAEINAMKKATPNPSTEEKAQMHKRYMEMKADQHVNYFNFASTVQLKTGFLGLFTCLHFNSSA